MLRKKYLMEIPLCGTEFPKKKPERQTEYLFIKIDISEECGEVLVADFYSLDKQLLKRFFTDGTTWTTLEGGKWHHRNIYSDYWGNPKYFELDQAGAVASVFFKKHGRDARGEAAYQIHSFIYWMNSEQRTRQADNRYQRMMDHINSVPKPPEGAGAYCDRYVFQNRYIVLMKEKAGKERQFKCLGCGGTFRKSGRPRHKSRMVCPECGEECIVFEERYIGSIKDKAKLLILHKVNGHVQMEWNTVVRTYDFYQSGTWPAKYLFDPYYYEIRTDKKIYLYHYVTSWWMAGFCKTKYPCTEQAHVYADNTKEVFDDGWCLGMNFDRLRYAGAISLYHLLRNAELKAAVQLYKVGLYQIAADADLKDAKICGEKFEEALGVNKVYLPLMKKYNASLLELGALKLSKTFLNDEMFGKMVRLVRLGGYGRIEGMKRVLNHMTFIKMLNYFSKQSDHAPKKDLSAWFDLYSDYMSMMKQLNRTLPQKRRLDLTDPDIRFPKDLKVAHDKTSQQLTISDNTAQDKALKRVAKALIKTHAFTEKGLTVVIPQGTADFVSEGNKLGHCVGSFKIYMENHIKGTWKILFIRKAEDPGTPYYTLTLYSDGNTIKECRGKHNCEMTAEVKRFVKKYCDFLNKALKQSKSRVA